MGAFTRALAVRQPNPRNRRWLFVPYDQLSDAIGPLAQEPPEDLGIVVVENPWKAARRPYHRQKLALLLSNLRHFALEQAERGVAVRHIAASGPYRSALAAVAGQLGPLRMMEPAEHELRADLAPLVAKGQLQVVPHTGWLTTFEQFEASQSKGPPYRMDAFYRSVRRKTGILMQGGKPLGGKYSFDAENRRSWKGQPPAPEPPNFAVDPIKQEVCQLVQTHFARHPGRLDPEQLPATRDEAQQLWQWACRECLPWFGPFEDAMSTRSHSLFHTRLSALLNLHRLLPAQVVADVAKSDLPLASQEGFIRQVLGWREFVRHVHRATDGFRQVRGQQVEVARQPGDAGYGAWSGQSWPIDRHHDVADGGACPNYLKAGESLPPVFWGRASGLNCLDSVVAEVWKTGYSHHITRLMVLANLATLLEVSPRELADWFWIAYTDAFDWVVEPNVLGMGTFAAGDIMTTKPYVSGANYIDRMSDYCAGCQFDPRSTCPIGHLYWAFLNRHCQQLDGNPRMALALNAAAARSPEQRQIDQMVFVETWRALRGGVELSPEQLDRQTTSPKRPPRGKLRKPHD